jgi:zinc protease
VSADPDGIAISVSGYPQDLTAYLKLVADAVIAPRRGEESFRERRNAAMDALEELETSDPEALGRVLAQVSFGPGHPYGRSELGTLASLAPLGLEDVVAQQDRVLLPRGATLLVVGDVDAAAAIAGARAAFRRWTRTGPPAPTAPPAAAPAPASRQPLAYLRRQPATTLVLCAARPLPGVHGDDAALELLAAVLGRGARSRLMLSLREEGGLAYAAQADVVQRRWARALLACAPVAAEHAGRAVELLQQAMARLAAAPPTGPELERARALLVADREALVDDAAGLSRAWLGALARGEDAPHPDRELAALRAVTPADVQRVARQVLRPDALQWIASGDAAAAAQAAGATGRGPFRPVALTR